jgi:hypothetical protein
MMIATIPNVLDWIANTFATLPMITGVAHILAGFIQTRRNEIAFYQQSIIIWMAAMAFGPAAIAWLRRTHGRLDMAFLIFTGGYVAAMFGFCIFIVQNLNSVGDTSNGPLECGFNDSGTLPKLFQKPAMETTNLVAVSVAVGIIVACLVFNCFKQYRRRALPFLSVMSGLGSKLDYTILGVILIVEVLLFVLVWEAAARYRNLFPSNAQNMEGSWTFGQIVPFTMLVYPILQCIRARIEGDIIAQVQQAGSVIEVTPTNKV